MSLTEYERETIVSMSDGGDAAQVYTAQRRVITRLKNNPAAELLDEGTHDGSAWARFTIPADLVSFRSAKVKRELTGEQRHRLSQAMRDRRAQQLTEDAATA